MKKQFSLFTEHKKIIITLVASSLFILLVVYTAMFYQDIMDLKKEPYHEVTAFIEEKAPNSEIIDMNRYHGDKLYYVVKARQNDDNFYYITSPEDEWKLYKFHTNDFYSRDEAMNDWKSRCNDCQYINDEIGMDNGYIVLEVNYKNTNEEYVIEHILLEDLSHYKLTLKRSLEH
mgnify:CR=1 FL=1